MLTLQAHPLFPFLTPKILPKTYKTRNPNLKSSPQTLQIRHFFTFLRLPGNKLAVKSVSSDEFPVVETFLEAFGPKEKESEDEAGAATGSSAAGHPGTRSSLRRPISPENPLTRAKKSPFRIPKASRPSKC